MKMEAHRKIQEDMLDILGIGQGKENDNAQKP